MNKYFKKTSIILVLFLLYSCTTNFETTELKSHFDTEQISDLKVLTKFFKSKICEDNSSGFKNCYENIYPEFLEKDWNPILERIEYKNQIEVYKQINKSTFNDIWTFCEITECCPDIKYNRACLNLDGKYFSFLKEISNSNTIVNKYTKWIIETGDIQLGYLENEILNNQSEFNLNNPNLQVILAIDYLSQNDQQKRERVVNN